MASVPIFCSLYTDLIQERADVDGTQILPKLRSSYPVPPWSDQNSSFGIQELLAEFTINTFEDEIYIELIKSHSSSLFHLVNQSLDFMPRHDHRPR